MGFANIGKHFKRQKTINVIKKGKQYKITIVVTNKTSFGNHMGFNVKVDDVNYHYNSLSWKDAMVYGEKKARE